MQFKKSFALIAMSMAATYSQADVIDVSISNLTQGMYFTPLLIAAHDDNTHLFQLGETATPELATMAEGGDITSLSTLASNAGAVISANPAAGLLAPASTTSITNLDIGELGYLSITAMILPTNDGFVGLNSWAIPEEAGSYTIYLNAYDAGSEANDEIVNGGGALGAAGIPVNPGANGGSNGTGVTSEETNQTVHIHRGNLGDTDANGGVSDVDSRIHRWLNPVAKVVVTVQ